MVRHAHHERTYKPCMKQDSDRSKNDGAEEPHTQEGGTSHEVAAKEPVR